MSEAAVRDNLETEYLELLNSQQFNESELDYSVVERYITAMQQFSEQSNSAVTIFDHFTRRHVFTSDNHAAIFGYCMDTIADRDSEYFDVRIHPEDFPHVMLNGVTCLKYFFIGNKNALNHKLIREYRVNVHGTYKRVSEQIQVLASDSRGNIWLALCIMDISPNQSPPYNVNSKLVNFKTGECITPVNLLNDSKPLLSEREVVILKYINEGLLSKEISAKLSISVHTVNTHRQRILEKLRVDTSIEAIKYAVALGLLDH